MARFAGLTKIAPGPARRALAVANATLETDLGLPAATEVEPTLDALDAAGADFDILRLFSVALPPREGVWWACMAARDLIARRNMPVPATLKSAEAWVYEPNETTRAAVRTAYDAAEPDDPVTLCAAAVSMIDGRLGPGDLSEHEAPAGAASIAVYGMVMQDLAEHEDDFAHYLQVLIARAADIARGGNGAVDPADITARPYSEDDDEDEEDDDELETGADAGAAAPPEAEES